MGVKRGAGGGFQAKVARLTPQLRRALKPVVYAIAGAVQADAKVSITNGAVSGKGHVASLPGEPPNNDTGHLASGIIVEQPDDLVAKVISTAQYGAALELGTSKMAERPYMRPAAKKNAERGRRQMKAAVDHVLKGGKFG
jgi:HK97 gp10 family phage protein